jgi:hypothetical protein
LVIAAGFAGAGEAKYVTPQAAASTASCFE